MLQITRRLRFLFQGTYLSTDTRQDEKAYTATYEFNNVLRNAKKIRLQHLMKAQMKNFGEKTGFILTITFRTHHRLVKHRKDNSNTLRRC